ncbi:MAG: tRNA pseudouridine(55) synthase TruB [Bacteroidetes bacterium]|nr:tRNA pseudouridine(55) synthase TruB [Bacteroidota bacterium]
MPQKVFDLEKGEVVLVNKPYHWTSFDVIGSIRYFFKKELGIKKFKIGHAGTLDPLATGLLILCWGPATKRIEEFKDFDKEYTGTFSVGSTTASFDLEKPVDEVYPVDHITEEKILEAAKSLTGDIQQVPPVFSAIKIKGKRAYDYARKDQEVEIAARPVSIPVFEITRIALPEVDFRIVCSKGTYIRSIARDFGKALDSGAHLTALCRTRVGPYDLQEAYTVDKVKELLHLQFKTEIPEEIS